MDVTINPPEQEFYNTELGVPYRWWLEDGRKLMNVTLKEDTYAELKDLIDGTV